MTGRGRMSHSRGATVLTLASIGLTGQSGAASALTRPCIRIFAGSVWIALSCLELKLLNIIPNAQGQ